MFARYAKLKKDWLLRGWRDVPWALVNWRSGEFRELGKNGFYVAKSCDGNTNFSSMAFFPEHLELLNKFIEDNVAEECAFGDKLEIGQEYRCAENILVRGVCFSITSRCNLNCRHCYMEAPSKRFHDFSTGEIEMLIDQFNRANVPEVALTGGEPFLRSDLPEIIRMLTVRKIGIAEIFSNGVLINDNILDVFVKHGHHPYFKISFDGCGTHDSMRGVKGCEEKVVAAIQRLVRRGFHVTIITSIDRINQSSLKKTYELLRDIGVNGWWLAPPVEIGNWKGSTTTLCMDETVNVCTRLLECWLLDNRPFHLKLWRFGLFEGNCQDGGEAGLAMCTGHFTPESWNCAGTHSRPYILPDGTLLPCSGYTDTEIMGKMPNLLDTEFSIAWGDAALRSITDMKKKQVIEFNNECKDCEHFSECGAGCRVLALTREGSLYSRDPEACALFKGGYIQRFREIAKRTSELVKIDMARR